MKQGNIVILSVLLSVIAAFAVIKLNFPDSHSSTAHIETAYERVLRTQTLRCGYEFWDSGLMRDPQTNEFSGAIVDILNEIGRAAQIKIEWTEHTSWGTEGAALKAGRIDAMCAGLWQSGAKAKEILFSIPFAYQGMEAFVNGNDHRFDNNLDRINNPDTTIMVIDADNSDFIAQKDFPKAKRVALGELNGTDAELLMSVGTKKGDITFTVPGLWRQFDKTNAGKVRRAEAGHNLRVYGLTVATDNNDERLMNILNVSIQEIANAGITDKIIDKYNASYPDMYLKPARAYQAQ